MRLIEELKQLYDGNEIEPTGRADQDEKAMAFAQPIIDNLPNRLRVAAQKRERSCMGAAQFVQGVGPQPQLDAGHRLVMQWLTDQGIGYSLQVSQCQEGAASNPWWNLIVHGWSSRKK